MTYSFTEKKRIRKSFGHRRARAVQEVPYLLATQLESYAEFLQEGVPADQRKDVGLQAALKSIFPISSHNDMARLEFVGYTLGQPAFDMKECQQRGLNFCAPLRAACAWSSWTARPASPRSKEVKEQEVYMGEIPLMTPTGSFVINGTERVSRLAAAPFARRVLRARPRQDPQLRQAALLGTDHPLPVARGWTSSSTPRISYTSVSTVAARCR